MECPVVGITSHLDLLVGLPSSWSSCLDLLACAAVVLLLGLGGGVLVVLLLGLGGGVLGEAVLDALLPALLHARGAAAAGGSTTAAAVLSLSTATCCCACCWVPAPPARTFVDVPEILFMSLFVISSWVLLWSG